METLGYQSTPGGRTKKITAAINLSVCCHAPVNEQPSSNPEKFIFECSRCNRECQVIPARMVRQYLAQQAQKARQTALDEKGQKNLEKLTAESPDYTGPDDQPDESELGEHAVPAQTVQPQTPQPPVQQPAPQPTQQQSGTVVTDGKVYHNGKLVGNLSPLTDEQWYVEKFGKEPDEWARENLSKLRESLN